MRSEFLTDATFTPENAKRASPAAEGLCKWVHAMSSYDKVRLLAFRPCVLITQAWVLRTACHTQGASAQHAQ